MGYTSYASRANQSANSLNVVRVMDTDIGGVAEGDLVYQDTVNPDKAIKATDNNSPGPVIGVVDTVIDSTTAKVKIMGSVDGFSGLSLGLPIYVSTSGTPTNTPPTVNYVQRLGVAIATDEIFLLIDSARVKRT